MYEVVGCSECGALWIRSGDAETASCARCGRTHRVDRLRTLASAPDADEAREARSKLLAERRATDPGSVAGYLETAAEADDEQVDSATHLAAGGVNPEKVADAGERAAATPPSRSVRDRVLAAVESCSDPTTAAIVEAAAEDDVAPETTRSLLQKLHQQGDITETNGQYRRL